MKREQEIRRELANLSREADKLRRAALEPIDRKMLNAHRRADNMAALWTIALVSVCLISVGLLAAVLYTTQSHLATMPPTDHVGLWASIIWPTGQ